MKLIAILWILLNSVLCICADTDKDNYHCITVKSRPGACFYFVHNENVNSPMDYCREHYNGRLATIANGMTPTELAKAYTWWHKSIKKRKFLLGTVAWNNNGECLFANKESDVVKIDLKLWINIFCKKKRNSTDIECLSDSFMYCKSLKSKFNVNVSETKPYQLTLNIDENEVFSGGYNGFICEAPRYPHAYCEPGWKLHLKTRSCFKMFNGPTEYKEALKGCRNNQAVLASINNMEEWHFVTSEFPIRQINPYNADGNGVWFGLRYKDQGYDHDWDGFNSFYDNAFNVDGSRFDKSNVVGKQGGWKMRPDSFPPWAFGNPQRLQKNCLGYRKLYITGKYYRLWQVLPNKGIPDLSFLGLDFLCRKIADQVFIN